MSNGLPIEPQQAPDGRIERANEEPQEVTQTLGHRSEVDAAFYAPDNVQAYTQPQPITDPLQIFDKYPVVAGEIPKNLTMADLFLMQLLHEATAWQPFRDFRSLALTAGAGSATFTPANEGYRVRINRIGISVSGASAAASVAVYVGQAGTDEAWLVDFANALLGSAPSRTVFSDNAPIYVDHAETLTIAIAGAATPSSLSCGIYGERRAV